MSPIVVSILLLAFGIAVPIPFAPIAIAWFFFGGRAVRRRWKAAKIEHAAAQVQLRKYDLYDQAAAVRKVIR